MTIVIVFVLLLDVKVLKEYTQADFMMPTVLNIKAYGKDAKHATLMAFDKIDAVLCNEIIFADKGKTEHIKSKKN